MMWKGSQHAAKQPATRAGNDSNHKMKVLHISRLQMQDPRHMPNIIPLAKQSCRSCSASNSSMLLRPATSNWSFCFSSGLCPRRKNESPYLYIRYYQKVTAKQITLTIEFRGY